MQSVATASELRERARAAFLGLALGDAYGRPLEFNEDLSVRTQPVQIAPGHFRWTDDTHMAIYLAKAILDMPSGPLNSEALGKAVAERFVEWWHDPLMPSTAPGMTCMQGAANYARLRDWKTCGVAESDGCGAVMRICPLAMAFRGEALIEAARISAVVTHGHRNAIESAIAASHMLRRVLETGEFDRRTVQAAIELLQRRPKHGTVVISALEAALQQAESSDRWLDERAIPEGDGGWRSPSALGLAVAAALRWEGSFEKVVDRAARILGDSDSVACLAGMYVGAAYGLKILPAPWLKIIPEREQMTTLADQLTGRAVIEELASGPKNQ